MLSKKTLIIIVVVVVVLVVLITAFVVVFKKPKTELEPEALEIAEDIPGLAGVIKEIRDRTLLVEANILLTDLEKKPIKQIVKMVVNDETKISKLEFPIEISAGSEPVSPKEIEISFNDLRIGDRINVLTVSNVSENIKNKTEFAVKAINVVEW